MANQIWSVKLRRAKWRHVQITQQPNARKWGQNSFQPYDFTYYMFIKPTFDFLVVGGLSSYTRMFHSYGEVTITREGLDILTYARHWLTLNSESSLACHICCDMGHSFTRSYPMAFTCTPVAVRLAV